MLLVLYQSLDGFSNISSEVPFSFGNIFGLGSLLLNWVTELEQRKNGGQDQLLEDGLLSQSFLPLESLDHIFQLEVFFLLSFSDGGRLLTTMTTITYRL